MSKGFSFNGAWLAEHVAVVRGEDADTRHAHRIFLSDESAPDRLLYVLVSDDTPEGVSVSVGAIEAATLEELLVEVLGSNDLRHKLEHQELAALFRSAREVLADITQADAPADALRLAKVGG